MFFVGCSSISSQEKICQEEADIAETVMDARLKHGQIANASVSLAGNNVRSCVKSLAQSFEMLLSMIVVVLQLMKKQSKKFRR